MRYTGKIATWGFIAFGVTMVLFGTLRATGQVLWPLIILFVSMYSVRLGVALGLEGGLGDDALWISFPVAMFPTLIMATGLYLHGGWCRSSAMNIIDPALAAASTEVSHTSEAALPHSALVAAAPPTLQGERRGG